MQNISEKYYEKFDIFKKFELPLFIYFLTKYTKLEIVRWLQSSNVLIPKRLRPLSYDVFDVTYEDLNEQTSLFRVKIFNCGK